MINVDKVFTLTKYKRFTRLIEPLPFNEVFKNTNIELVQVHCIEWCMPSDIIGFCGTFKYENNEIISLDGDSYNKEALVYGYNWFENEDNIKCLDILVGDDW